MKSSHNPQERQPDPPAARKLLVLLELASAEASCLITSHDAGCSCRLCRESGRAFWLLRTLQSKLMLTVRLTLLEQAGPVRAVTEALEYWFGDSQPREGAAADEDDLPQAIRDRLRMQDLKGGDDPEKPADDDE